MRQKDIFTNIKKGILPAIHPGKHIFLNNAQVSFSAKVLLVTFLLMTSIGYACTSLLQIPTDSIYVHNVYELNQAIATANNTGNRTIALASGTYELTQPLSITGNNITVRSISGNREDVILTGGGMNPQAIWQIFMVYGDHCTIANMTMGWVATHAIQIHGENDADNLLVHNIHILDTYEQMIKGSWGNNDTMSSNDSIIECSLFEYSDEIGPQYYIGGIDVHHGKNWIVRENTFKYIRSPNPDRLAEYAIHFWNSSEGTLVEKNTIINCDRGIGFGMGNSSHIGGIIRNNFIYGDETNRDVGIALESATNSMVYHNTIFQEHNYYYAIEFRFATTSGIIIRNNLANKAIAARDDEAQGELSHNITNAQSSWFVNPTIGDLHLANNSISNVINQAISLPEVHKDFDGQTRGAMSDIGADEYFNNSLVFPIPPILLILNN